MVKGILMMMGHDIIYHFSFDSWKIAVEFTYSCLKQDKATFTHRNEVNLIIVSELDTSSRDLSIQVTLGNRLFGAVKLLRIMIVINM